MPVALYLCVFAMCYRSSGGCVCLFILSDPPSLLSGYRRSVTHTPTLFVCHCLFSLQLRFSSRTVFTSRHSHWEMTSRAPPSFAGGHLIWESLGSHTHTQLPSFCLHLDMKMKIRLKKQLYKKIYFKTVSYFCIYLEGVMHISISQEVFTRAWLILKFWGRCPFSRLRNLISTYLIDGYPCNLVTIELWQCAKHILTFYTYISCYVFTDIHIIYQYICH